MLRKLLVILSVLLVVWCAPAVEAAGKSYGADRFDVDAAIAADGSMQVTETVVFRFTGGPFTYVYRDLPSEYTDGIGGIVATMDGAVLPAGRQPGQIEIEGGGSHTKVTWHFAPTSDATHTFVLKYRMAGVIRRDADADRLLWDVLPDEHAYAIASSTVRVTYPAAARVMPGSRIARGSGLVTSAPGVETFTARDLRQDRSLRVEVRFQPGSLVETAPEWQARAARQLETAPYFGAGALGVLGIGLLGFVLLWTSNRRERSTSLDGGLRPTAPPGALSPAIAGALVGGGSLAAWPQALGALFDLARRGVLGIEESPESHWYRRQDFVIHHPPAPTGWRTAPQPEEDGTRRDLQPHEQGLLDLLFTAKAGMATSVKLSDLQGKVGRRWKLFAEPLKAEMKASGLLDPAREAVRTRFLVLGIVLLIALAPGLAVGVLLLRSFGGWPYLILAALFLLSMVAFVLSAAYSPLSEAGVEAAARWRGFRGYLADVTKGKEPAWDLRQFERDLPYAASFGLAEKWAKAFQQRGGVEIPAWFRALAATPEQGMNAFVAFTAAGHSAGSSGGAGGAGGAAGGGGSGAG